MTLDRLPHPLESRLGEILAWLNEWADEATHDEARWTPNWRQGYDQAVRDIMGRLEPLVPDWHKSRKAQEAGE